jgi:hypothetical protein
MSWRGFSKRRKSCNSATSVIAAINCTPRMACSACSSGFKLHSGSVSRMPSAGVLVKSRRAAERVIRSITRYLQTTLKLTVNLAKSKVAPMSECSRQARQTLCRARRGDDDE